MQITKELLDGEVKSMVDQNEVAKATMYKTVGALDILKGLREYMDRPEPEPTPPISPENDEVQKAEEAKMQAAVDGNTLDTAVLDEVAVEPVPVKDVVDMQALETAVVGPTVAPAEVPAPEKQYRYNANGKLEEI